MHIIYQMKENLSVCMNIFFFFNKKRKGGGEDYFCNVRFFFSITVTSLTVTVGHEVHSLKVI